MKQLVAQLRPIVAVRIAMPDHLVVPRRPADVATVVLLRRRAADAQHPRMIAAVAHRAVAANREGYWVAYSRAIRNAVAAVPASPVAAASPVVVANPHPVAVVQHPPVGNAVAHLESVVVGSWADSSTASRSVVAAIAVAAIAAAAIAVAIRPVVASLPAELLAAVAVAVLVVAVMHPRQP